MKNRQNSILQNGIYALIWLILLIIPIFGYRDNDSIHWNAVMMFWVKMLPFLLLFALNNYILIPRLLVRRRYAKYLTSVVVVIAGVLVLNHIFVRTYIFSTPSFRVEKSQTTVVKPQSDTLALTAVQTPSEKAKFDSENPRRRHFRPAMWQFLLMDGIVSILLVGTNAAICLMFLSIADRVRLREMESQSLKSELDYLKSQINPHFFMNTLNNIHALVDIDAERAKESIIELSKIMRYVLYDTNLSTVPLQKEIEFIQNYVCLMRMRYTDEVQITTRYPSPVIDVALPPLMLVALIENAFKHGISYQQKSFINLSLDVVGDELIYTVENSYFAQKTATDPASGVGLSNLRKRLELLYGDNGQLSVCQVDNRYTATLKLQLR